MIHERLSKTVDDAKDVDLNQIRGLLDSSKYLLLASSSSSSESESQQQSSSSTSTASSTLKGKSMEMSFLRSQFSTNVEVETNLCRDKQAMSGRVFVRKFLNFQTFHNLLTQSFPFSFTFFFSHFHSHFHSCSCSCWW